MKSNEQPIVPLLTMLDYFFSPALKTTMRNLWVRLHLLLLFIIPSLSVAEPLPPQQAFIPEVISVDGNSINLRINMNDGYYLYRETRFGVDGIDDGLVIESVSLSPGIIKNDAFFGEQSVWYGGKNPAEIRVRYQNPNQLTSSILRLSYQGCQDGVICYPPQTVELPIGLPVNQFAAPSATTDRLFGKKSPITTQQTSGLSVSSRLGSDNTRDAVLNLPKNDGQVLSEDAAFPFVIEPVDATTLALRFSVADGYYLYRDKIKLTAVDSAAEATADKHVNNDETQDEKLIANVNFREGDIHRDEFFGEQRVYRGDGVIANVYLTRPVETLTLDLQFQGCAERGICYPVMNRQIMLDNGFVSSVTALPPAPNSSASVNPSLSTLDVLGNALKNNLWAGVGLLLLAGIALAFTPCVLPMLPILLGIITNQRKISKSRALMLSSAYALGVASMMAVFGLVVAKTGINLQIIFQKPLWLIAFAAIFIIMGLAMLGLFTVAMPGGIQNKIIHWQNQFQDSNPFSVFIVGALSTLVVGPCVAPPLIAVLAFISTTGDSTLGAVYLFALGLGMSLPLVVFASLITTVPKTGALSTLVKRLFAMLMFGVGLWLLARLFPGWLSLTLWGVFMLVLAGLFWASGLVSPFSRRIAQTLSIIAALLGGAWLVGGAMGNSNPLKPFTTVVALPFERVDTQAALANALNHSQQPVMVDLYADWCVACQEVEHFTLTDSRVVDALGGIKLIKLDITDTTAEHSQILADLGLIGPPAMLFYKNGQEVRDLRHVGAIKPAVLVNALQQLNPLSE